MVAHAINVGMTGGVIACIRVRNVNRAGRAPASVLERRTGPPAGATPRVGRVCTVAGRITARTAGRRQIRIAESAGSERESVLVADRLCRHPLEFLVAIQEAHTLRHPGGRGLALEVVAEPLVDAAVVVDLVRLLRQPVVLALVDQQDHLLPRPARGVVEDDALVPVHGAILVAERHEHGGVQGLDVVDGGVGLVAHQVLPRRDLHAALADLEDARVGATDVPVDGQVHAGELRERRARHGRGEDIGLRGHERGLVPAPRVPDEADPVLVDVAHCDDLLDGRNDRIGRGQPRIPVAVYVAFSDYVLLEARSDR